MPRARTITSALLAALAAVVVAAPTDAAKRPSKAAAAAIERVALNACAVPQRPCDFHGAKISTRNPRFAWADVVAEGFSGVLLKRPSARSLRFRVIGTQGGGIGECAYWRKRAPRPVLRDLRIFGLVDSSGTTRTCG